MATESFDIAVSPDVDPGQTLVVGLSHLGLGAVTAADYLVRHQASEEIGHVAPEDLPAITPFENGQPRHHTRLYNLTEFDLTVLVGELFVPVWAARPFTDALVEWVTANQVREIAVLHGVPFPHGPDEHDTFYVASDPYREEHLEGTEIQPLKGGFLDGVAGELVTRSLEADAPPVGVIATPTHPPGPDVEAALQFLDVIETIYGVSVDRAELTQLSEEIKQHYATLADRMATIEDSDQSWGSRDRPEDRMYM